MSSATPLLSSLLVLLGLLHGALSIAEGQRCNIHALNECDEGLICVATGANAFCESLTRNPCDTVACTSTSLWCPRHFQYIPEGECCPVCPPRPTASYHPAGCTEDGVHHEEGEEWKRDPCTTCHCTGGEILCAAVSCAPLTCPYSVILPGECCGTCIQLNVITPAPASDNCIVDGQEYENGEWWQPGPDPCRTAHCSHGEVLESVRACEAPQCDNPVYLEGVCCPTCPEITALRAETVATEPPTTATPECEALEDGVILGEGEKHCPAPNVTAVCRNGVVELSHHCPPLSCTNIIRGQNSCDCPICVGDAHHFEVGGRLHMNRIQFMFRARQTDLMLRQLARDSGLYPDHNDFSNCNNMICLRMNVLSPDLDDTEEKVVEKVRTELESKPHSGLEIGHMEEFIVTKKRSARSVGDAEPLSSSSSSDRHVSVATTAAAVSASVLGAAAMVVGVALLASFVRRKQTVRSTITV